MSERAWRLIVGVLILVFLSVDSENLVYFDSDTALLGLVAWLGFEGLTNFRLTKLISWLRWRGAYLAEMEKAVSGVSSARKINFEAERMLRFSITTILFLTVYPGIVAWYPEVVNKMIWAIPWLVGLMLTSAGLTSICPMLMVLQWLGFKSKYH